MSRTPNQPGGTPRPGATPAPAGHSAGHASHRHPAAPAAATVPAGAAGTSTKPSTGAAAAAPANAATAAAQQKRRNLILGASAAGALILLVALFVWKPWAPAPPRLNAPVGEIAKFAASPRLHRLPFESQRQYMELLDEKDDAVDKAYEEGALGDQEFRRALQLAWYGEHLKKMDNFFSKHPLQRAMYLDKQVDKKIKKKKKKKAGPEPDSGSALTVEEIDRDDSTEQEDIERWPPEVRQRWNDYRTAYANRKQYWKDQEKLLKEKQEAKNGAAGKGGAAGEGGKTDPATEPEAAAPTGSSGGQ